MHKQMDKQTLRHALLQHLRRLLGRDPDKDDPYARVRVPVKKGPGGLKATVALKEPRA